MWFAVLSAWLTVHHSCWHCSSVLVCVATSRIRSDDPVLMGILAVLYSCLKRWKAPTSSEKKSLFYTAFKLVLKSLNKEEIRSCVSRNPFSPLLAEASFEPRSFISFVRVQVNMLLHKRVGNGAADHFPCLGRTEGELLKGYRYSGWGGLDNLWISSWDEPNHFIS